VELQFTIRPAVSPLDRADLEERVLEALGDGADCLGGGSMVDGSESDFAIELDDGFDADDVVARCRAVFAKVPFSLPTTVELRIGGHVIDLQTPVYD
jgi:hypothetical protein